jgi:hypothetical protein
MDMAKKRDEVDVVRVIAQFVDAPPEVRAAALAFFGEFFGIPRDAVATALERLAAVFGETALVLRTGMVPREQQEEDVTARVLRAADAPAGARSGT